MPTARLKVMALRGADNRPWYAWARAEIVAGAPVLGIDPVRMADLLALFSPRVNIKTSVRLTTVYVRTGKFDTNTLPSIRASVYHYEQTREIRGPKTAPFAKALMGDEGAVVLDTWMAVAFGINPRWIADRPRLRRRMARTIVRIAEDLGWPPAETQAAVWATAVRSQGPYARVRIIGLLEEINRVPDLADFPY